MGRNSLIQLSDECGNIKSLSDNDNELQSILAEKASEVCLLIDSPFRILRVRIIKFSFSFQYYFKTNKKYQDSNEAFRVQQVNFKEKKLS